MLPDCQLGHSLGANEGPQGQLVTEQKALGAPVLFVAQAAGRCFHGVPSGPTSMTKGSASFTLPRSSTAWVAGWLQPSQWVFGRLLNLAALVQPQHTKMYL